MIIIPMAGMSSRFFKAGYTKPKYMLEAHGKTLFEHSIESFKAYFSCQPFLFIVKDTFSTYEFVNLKASEMGIKQFYIVTLDSDTRGQAETVTLGIKNLVNKGIRQEGAIIIFNIDTFRPGFILPKVSYTSDGYLEVFKGEGHNWSFVKPAAKGSTKVIQTAEKNPISNLCSTGLYYFKCIDDYLDAYADYVSKPESDWEKGELYIAPLYNYLIKKGLKISYNLIDEKKVTFCGTPVEYEKIAGKKC